MLLGYIRVSTSDGRQDGGLDAQRRALIAAGVEERHIYSDEISGSVAAADRPGLAKVLAMARDGDVLTVWRLDRLGRSLVDVVTTVDRLTAAGIGVRSIQEGIDPSTPTGRLMLGLLATLAEFERSVIQDRIRSGVSAARARGVVFGRPRLDPAEVAVKVRTVRELVAGEGMTVEQAARIVGWSRPTFYRNAARVDAAAD